MSEAKFVDSAQIIDDVLVVDFYDNSYKYALKFDKRDDLLLVSYYKYSGRACSEIYESDSAVINLNNLNYISNGYKLYFNFGKENSCLFNYKNKINGKSIINILFDYLSPKKIKSANILNL
jgi:hypothetical protein